MRAAPLAKLSSGTVRLSKVDKMLYSTCTQEAPMIINTLLTMDGLVPIDQLKSFLTELAFKHPRLRMRVVDKGGHPTWTPTDLNLDSVVHYHRVPPNTTFVEYIDKKKLLEGQIDTTSHLWEWHGILDNDGNHVFLVRLHHVLGDGLSLVKLVMSMFDSDEDAMPSIKDGAKKGNKPAKKVPVVGAGNVLKKTNGLFLIYYALRLLISWPFVILSLVFWSGDKPNVFRNPTFKEVAKRIAYTPCGKVSDLKFIGKMFGGTINDVISAILAGALRRYQEERREKEQKEADKQSIQDITLVIPISTRSPREVGVVLDNKVASVFLKVPVKQPDLEKRFQQTKARMDSLKYGPVMPIMIFLIKVVLSSMPLWFTKWQQELFASKASMIFSNVPGPRERKHIRGFAITNIFGFVPLVGFQQCGFACFSYAGNLSLSVVCNPTTVPDPDRFCELFKLELAEYHKIAHDKKANDETDMRSGKTTVRRRSIIDTKILGLSSGKDHASVHEAGEGPRRKSTLAQDLFTKVKGKMKERSVERERSSGRERSSQESRKQKRDERSEAAMPKLEE